MDSADTILGPPCDAVQQKSRVRHLLGLFRQWQAGCPVRARRVLLLVLAIWVFNLFDLNFTLLACRIGGFEELNPLARTFIASDEALVIYKFAMVIPGTLILLFFRRRLSTEIGCWLLFAAHMGLSGMWVAYYWAYR